MKSYAIMKHPIFKLNCQLMVLVAFSIVIKIQYKSFNFFDSIKYIFPILKFWISSPKVL